MITAPWDCITGRKSSLTHCGIPRVLSWIVRTFKGQEIEVGLSAGPKCIQL